MRSLWHQTRSGSLTSLISYLNPLTLTHSQVGELDQWSVYYTIVRYSQSLVSSVNSRSEPDICQLTNPGLRTWPLEWSLVKTGPTIPCHMPASNKNPGRRAHMLLIKSATGPGCHTAIFAGYSSEQNWHPTWRYENIPYLNWRIEHKCPR